VTDSTDALVERYLERLHTELADVPPSRRDEIVEQISEHIAAGRAELPTGSESEVRSLLERLGDPAVIAEEAGERRERPAPQRRWLEVLALVLLLVGGVILPVVGWFVGVVLLWVSTVWSTRDKLIGTLVFPGGLLPAFAVGFLAGDAESCGGEIDPRTGAVLSETCTGGTSTGGQVVAIAVFVVLLVGPILTTAYLARRMKRQGQRLESRPAI
jgi:hypothetical protein